MDERTRAAARASRRRGVDGYRCDRPDKRLEADPHLLGILNDLLIRFIWQCDCSGGGYYSPPPFESSLVQFRAEVFDSFTLLRGEVFRHGYEQACIQITRVVRLLDVGHSLAGQPELLAGL